MSKFELIQTRLDAFGTKIIEKNTIGEFPSNDLAVDFLTKRGFKFDTVADAWINGNCIHFPVAIVKKEQSLFSINSFV